MLILDADAVARALPYEQLIDALDAAFRSGATAPPRVHYEVPVSDAAKATLLLMPAWQADRHLGVKIATVFPDNSRFNKPAVQASYLLMDGGTGTPLAVFDGTELTLRRTAAASALASRYLSKPSSARLLMIGTGNLAPHLVRAHMATRPIREVVIWGRRPEAASALAAKLATKALAVRAVSDLPAAVQEADIISTATLATTPLVRGEWLREGQHLDLVGAFQPHMSEADPVAIRRSEVYVDTLAGALAEAGDLLQAIDCGALEATDIRGDLSQLADGSVPGRENARQITLFKSVGAAIEDLAAAQLALRNAGRD